MEEQKGKSIASLVLGIVSLILIFTGMGTIAGIILAIVGVNLGKSVKRSGYDNGMAKAGRVLSWIGLILCIIVLVLVLVACGAIISLVH